VNVVVDTPVWSLLLRREKPDPGNPFITILRFHLDRSDCIHLIGPILQELLDGIKYRKHFDTLVDYFTRFPLIEIDRNDYIEAARLKNICRSHGIQAGPIDALIAAVCAERGYPLLTADKDFDYIARVGRLILLRP
jgi:hypothetical protein